MAWFKVVLIAHRLANGQVLVANGRKSVALVLVPVHCLSWALGDWRFRTAEPRRVSRSLRHSCDKLLFVAAQPSHVTKGK